MKYRKGYKGIVAEDFSYQTGWFVGKDIKTDLIELTRTGRLTIKKGYASDFCSGATIDRRTTRHAGVIHDAICQLIRLGLLEPKYLQRGNELFKKVLLEDGCWKITAEAYYLFVSRLGKFAARPGYEPYPILEAP